MARPPITRRQREILDFIREFSSEQGMSPTLEEIAQRFGVNKVTIFGHVSELERKGILSRAARGVSRALRIVDELQPSARKDTRIPILGRIAAGAPIEAIEVPEEFDLGDVVPSGCEVYALRVQGDSMVEDGIHDGDVVLVERRNEARDGETVVAVLPDEEATLKRFYLTETGVRLEPANAALKPIHVPSVEIRGVVVGVVRRF